MNSGPARINSCPDTSLLPEEFSGTSLCVRDKIAQLLVQRERFVGCPTWPANRARRFVILPDTQKNRRRTMPENSKKSPSRSSSSRSSGEGRFPIDNLTYDLITVIHEKSQGLEAFDRYLKDAGEDEECKTLFEEIRQQDEDAIKQLTQALRDRFESQAEEEAA